MRFQKVAIWIALLAGFALGVSRPLGAVNSRTIEEDWTPDFYQGYSSAATSTHNVTGIGTGFAVLALGSTCQYSVHFTTKTFPDGSVSISSSVTHIAPEGRPVNQDFRAIHSNPKIVVHGLNTAATVYIWIEYLRRRVP